MFAIAAAASRSRSAAAQVPASERAALLALYSSTNGAGWLNNTGWTGGVGTECTWYGVSCLGGVVRQLLLGANGLHGTLPDAMGDLTYLQQVQMDANALEGDISGAVAGVLAPASHDLRYNAFCESGALSLAENNTQTHSPSNLAVTSVTSTSLTLTWTPIAYTADNGFYTVYGSRNGGGFQSYGTTPGATKSDSELSISGLTPASHYDFYVLTTTIAGPQNSNTLTGGCETVVGVDLPGPASITSFDATPGTITAGDGATLSWATTDATSASLDQGIGSIPVNGSLPVTPETTTTYTLTATGPYGSDSAQVTVTVHPPPVPFIASFTATPPGIRAGEQTTLAWSSTNGTAASIDNGVGSVLPTGSKNVSPTGSTIYTLTVTGPGGTASRTAAVSVQGAPSILGFAASPSTIPPGGSSVLTWSSSGGETASIEPLGAVPVNGSATVTPSQTTVYKLTVTANGLNAVANATVAVVCPAPQAPQLTTSATDLTAGQTAVVTWNAVSDLLAGSGYVVESSRDGFATIETTIATSGISATLVTDPSATTFALSVRVRAVQPCGASTTSNVLELSFGATPPVFVSTRSLISLQGTVGQRPPSAVLTYRNVGAVAIHLDLAQVIGFRRRPLVEEQVSFYSFEPKALDIPPGEERSVTVQAAADSMSSVGSYGGAIAASAGPGLDDDVLTPVTLSVVPGLIDTSARGTSSVSTLSFQAGAGLDPAPLDVDVDVTSFGSAPVYLSVSIGPGGGWLKVAGPLSSPVPASGRVTLTLSVDRSRRVASDGTPPRTIVRITPVGGDPLTSSALLEVVDVDTPSVQTNVADRVSTASRPTPLAALPAKDAFIVPTAVKARSGLTQQFFTSDGWLRNVGAAPVDVQLYFTPDSRNGLTENLKTTLTIPEGTTYRLSDFLANVFKADAISGQVEVRSSNPASLTLRTTVDSVASNGDPATRFGTEIPTTVRGAGAVAGLPELVIAGVVDDAAHRTNVILSETRGESANVRCDVHGADGSVLATRTLSIAPYSKVQFDLTTLLEHAPVTGGWVGVDVTSGRGSVFALATVIDNASGSFSAVEAKRPRSVRASVTPQAATARPLRYLIPSLVKAVGLNNTKFSTTMSLVNSRGTPAHLGLTFLYNGSKTATATLDIPPRAALDRAIGSDVIERLFHVTETAVGSVVIDGDVAGIVCLTAISAQVDPNDASKGFKTAQVNGFFVDAQEIAAVAGPPKRFAGAEKGVQKRTNVIFVEVDGKPCRVLLKAFTQTGDKMAETEVDVGPHEYRQINDVFGDAGLRLGEGPFQNVDLTMEVVSGEGRVLGLATPNDNISRNPEIFVLQDAGPPQIPSTFDF